MKEQSSLQAYTYTPDVETSQSDIQTGKPPQESPLQPEKCGIRDTMTFYRQSWVVMTVRLKFQLQYERSSGILSIEADLSHHDSQKPLTLPVEVKLPFV